MKDIVPVKPEEFFLEISPLKKHPNFKKLYDADVEKNIIQEKVLKKGRKRKFLSTYKHWLQRRSRH